MTKLPLAAAFLATSATALFAADPAPLVQTGKYGEEVYLMDGAKMTLYTFDKDEQNLSNCYDMCAANWPPVLAEAGTDLPRGYGVAERKDGTLQVSYKGQPLYLWIKDSKPGDMTGDGVNGVWHIARP
ncbi:hypothetical protein M4578_24240 [Salipiger sp. P9]|uniref:COG4315 family predicted lipoprotein n=1 Tax=Salipiger pentaromativorans TaxID=2943193 RepID=UPI002158879F|nr:hypothetical protein [Salipiger pentaromativorans]MCR8550943.1 hypothetical protein [Salipiger pentaromativorans]